MNRTDLAIAQTNHRDLTAKAKVSVGMTRRLKRG